jgi:hypothetical protein
VAQSELCLVTCEHLVGELKGSWTRQGGRHEALQLTACSKLGDDAFEHMVADERASDLLGQRAGERSVDKAGDLGC